MYLKSMREKDADRLVTGENIVGDVLVHPSAKVDPTAKLGPNVVIGENCEIGPGSRIYNATVMAETKVIGYALIEGSIVGWKDTIGKWVRINGLTVLAEDVQIRDDVYLN